MRPVTDGEGYERQQQELIKQLPMDVKRQLVATLALAGWTFPRHVVHIDTHNQPVRTVYSIVTPIGEGYAFQCETIEEAGVYAWGIWEDGRQAMWTGRPLSDFPEYGGAPDAK